MLKKKTFSQFDIKVNSVSLKKKIVNLNLYNKSFLKSNSFIKAKDIVLIDNYNKDNVINNNFLIKNYKQKEISGLCINSKYNNYSNTTFDPIQFNLNSLFLNYHNTFLNSFYKSFDFFFNEQNKLKYFIILKPIKGGFKSYSGGFIGFVPRKHVLFIIHKIFKNFFKKKFGLKKIFKLKNLLLINPSFFFRLPFVEYKFIIYINHLRQKRFVFFKYNKRRGKINNLNTVFLTKTSEKKISKI